jgi:polar amino acid transport system substrate-binding protein
MSGRLGSTFVIRRRLRRLAARGGCVSAAVLLIAACSDRSSSPAAGTFKPARPGVLTVVTSDLPSPGFWNGRPGHITGGLEYELAKGLAQRFHLKAIDVKISNFHRIVGGHLDGADIALDLITPTAERARHLTFSSPYLDAAATVVTRVSTTVPDLATAQTLRWGAVRGTTFVETLNRLIAPDAPPQLFDGTTAMLTALEAGRIDAILLDMPFAVATANHSGGRLSAVAQLPDEETVAAALPKGSSNEQAVDSAFRAFTADGTLNDLVRVWIGPKAADAEKAIPVIRTTR